ncbi:hypothetical protein JMJ35_002986 [Cladonia borealis]|uniref:Uncharacterized protein n=1 Tax=Cladonia borealis TaxID=184061 RepID=A0AA39R659_9LECA|nr:hypothetical protein JMJ35_002986 [Cladonia borealis]
MTEHEELLLNQDEYEEEGDDLSRVRTHDTLLIDEPSLERSVGLLYLLTLTCGVGGLQVIWSVILSNGSPFLVSLGLSKSLTALVWVAAPLSGVVVQPLVGTWSDRIVSRLGRRRPFIIGGAIGVVLSMLALAWIEDLTYGFTKPSNYQQSPTQTWAGLRTLIVENCPTHQQNQASAWAGAMTGVGNTLGYLSGFTVLPELFRSKHLTQFQCLCMIASVSLTITVTISCSILEPDSPPERVDRAGFLAVLSDLLYTYRSMPLKVRKVCHIQFFAWMGWFPFLFYSTTYVGEFYAARVKARDLAPGSIQTMNRVALIPRTSSGTADPKDGDGLCEDAIRFGTFASFLFAIVAFLANILLPFVLPALNQVSSSTTPSKKFHISQLWFWGHTFFALAMFATFFIRSQLGATLLVACIGLSWALTLWAPFAIIGNELSARQSLRDCITDISGEEPPPASRDVQAGAIMGLHNVAISSPQIIAALACSGIFGLAKMLGSQTGTGWVLRAGGSAALGAAYLTSRFDR